ncbi:HTH CENPB-type domain-containing protein [Aphis craccivora]|uniref:HTH CENPB-type domain-containing protein n=1 Tax=Aphis craccivora TaxID=307492 RepID=A0A6G0VYV0_APHCR|nr:HTH CENPB-type domain-containing protein [Aphis craccivora]
MPKKRNIFSEANLASAINAVLNDGPSKKAAARQFSVSRSTIQHRIKNPGCKITCGPAAVLSEEEEMMLEYWILECCFKGFPRRKEDL